MTNEELAMSIKAGHTEDVAALWEQIVKLIQFKAAMWKRAYPDSLPDTEDFVQSGYFAMMNAVRYYDPEKEYAFTSYLNLTLKTAFAEVVGIRTPKQRYAAKQHIVSLDAPLGGDDDNNLLVDMLADPNATIPFEELEASDEQMMIRDVLEDAADRLLSRKQRMVFDELLDTERSITDIAKANGLEKQCVSRLRDEAFWKLKTDAKVNELYSLVYGMDDDLYSNSLRGTGLTAFKNTGLSVVERLAYRRMTRHTVAKARKQGYTAEESIT